MEDEFEWSEVLGVGEPSEFVREGGGEQLLAHLHQRPSTVSHSLSTQVGHTEMHAQSPPLRSAGERVSAKVRE